MQREVERGGLIKRLGEAETDRTPVTGARFEFDVTRAEAARPGTAPVPTVPGRLS